jgi:hypothetical protein
MQVFSTNPFCVVSHLWPAALRVGGPELTAGAGTANIDVHPPGSVNLYQHCWEGKHVLCDGKTGANVAGEC